MENARAMAERPGREDAGAHYRMGYLMAVCLVAALGGLLFGYDWVVIGGAKPFYEKFFGLTEAADVAWAMSCALVGCLIGAVLSGLLADRLGRKWLLVFAALLFTATSVGTGLAPSFRWFVVNRIVGGVAIGLASNLSPMYIAEMAPARWRGLFVSVNQLTIVIGILLAQVVNWLIAQPVPPGATAADILASWNGQVGWRWMFWATVVPSLVFLVSMLLVPESPRWLATHGREERARQVLTRVGGDAYAERALDAIRTVEKEEAGQVGLAAALTGDRAGKLLWILLIGVVLAVFQQWCGINVIFNYADEVFRAAGYEVSDILLNIVITGTINLAFTLVALAVVDRLGRRPLMLLGSLGLAAIYALLGYGYFRGSQGPHMLALVGAAIATYAMSLAPVTWVVLSEIFPNRIRGAFMAVCVVALWAACFVLTYTFPILNAKLGPAKTFWIYGGICLAGFAFILATLPETKGKTLEQIEQELTGRSGPAGDGLPVTACR